MVKVHWKHVSRRFGGMKLEVGRCSFGIVGCHLVSKRWICFLLLYEVHIEIIDILYVYTHCKTIIYIYMYLKYMANRCDLSLTFVGV